MKRYILLFLLGCATVPQTPAMGIRAQIEGRLRLCLMATCNRSWFERHRCVVEEENACRNNGLEADCGTGGMWTNPPSPLSYNQSCATAY